MPPQTLAAVATLLSFAQHGNRIEFRLDHGAAELTWISASTLRFRRTIEGPLPEVKIEDRGAPPYEIEDTPARVTVRSQLLEVSLQKRGVLVRVRVASGVTLVSDLTEPTTSAEGLMWDRFAPADARYYGLGPRVDAALDLRGKAVATETPFLLSTVGFGEYHHARGAYRFDFTAPNRYRVQAPGVDYSVYYGPTPKQVFEEHRGDAASATWSADAEGAGSWGTLHETLLRLVHGAMSAKNTPSIALRPYEGAAEELKQRARQLGSLVDDVSPGPLGLSGFRKQLESFFAVYAFETRDKGFPIWHPLPFQFPEDPECARHADEFLLGDEMLIAPIVEPGGKRQLYLPQGIWTNLETNEVFTGRRTITVETASLPVFARNGVIVPLDSPGGMALHYFGKLPAEFFLLESDVEEWTQAHASPAADEMRLEIEPKKTHDYQWVVHHVDRPAEIGYEGRKYREVGSPGAVVNGTWYYDAAQRNLQVRLHAEAGEDSIINLVFR